jgi:hypothetical protein
MSKVQQAFVGQLHPAMQMRLGLKRVHHMHDC